MWWREARRRHGARCRGRQRCRHRGDGCLWGGGGDRGSRRLGGGGGSWFGRLSGSCRRGAGLRGMVRVTRHTGPRGGGDAHLHGAPEHSRPPTPGTPPPSASLQRLAVAARRPAAPPSVPPTSTGAAPLATSLTGEAVRPPTHRDAREHARHRTPPLQHRRRGTPRRRPLVLRQECPHPRKSPPPTRRTA